MKKKLTARFIHSCYILPVLNNMTHYQKIGFDENSYLEFLKKGGSLTYDQLERFFPRLMRRTYELAQAQNLRKKSPEAARLYWLVEHNLIIERKEEEYSFMTSTQRELCKTGLGKILEITPISYRDVEEVRVEIPTGKKKKVLNLIYPNKLIKGDYVSFHYEIIAEILKEEEYKYYEKLRNLSLIF